MIGFLTGRRRLPYLLAASTVLLLAGFAALVANG